MSLHVGFAGLLSAWFESLLASRRQAVSEPVGERLFVPMGLGFCPVFHEPLWFSCGLAGSGLEGGAQPEAVDGALTAVRDMLSFKSHGPMPEELV